MRQNVPLVNFGNILLKVDPMWTSCINASLNLAGSRNDLTCPFGFGTVAPLCFSSAPRDVTMSCCCSHSNYSLNDFVVPRLHALAVPDKVCCFL